MRTNYVIPVNEKQASAYETVAKVKQKELTPASKDEMKQVAQEFGSLGLTKWQALSLAYNYYKKDKSIPVKEKMTVLKEGVLNPKSFNYVSNDPKKKKAKPFWKIDARKGQPKIVIEPSDLVSVLNQLGYYKFKKSKTGYVRLKGKIITEADASDMQEEVKSYLFSIPSKKLKKLKDPSEVWEFIINRKYLFREATLSYLSPLNYEFHRDSKDEINLYLNTGFLKIKADNLSFKPYTDLEGIIWSKSVMKAQFTELDYRKSDYEKFIGNTQKNNVQRIDNAMRVLGYLMHRYNFRNKMKIARFIDELVSTEANGGTGKNVSLELLNYVRSVVIINGKKLDLKSRFSYQLVEDYNDIVILNDVKKNLDEEDLYNDSTEGVEIEKKGVNAVANDKDNNKKIVITANRRKLITAGSTRRRVVDVYYSDYYNSNYSVFDEFGKEFFVDFDNEEWDKTLTFAIRCAQLYLKNGLPELKSVDEERLEMAASSEFIEFMNDVVAKETKINRSKLRIRYKEFKGVEVGTKNFCKWAEEYFKVKGIRTKGFITSNGKTYASKTSSYFYEIVPNN